MEEENSIKSDSNKSSSYGALILLVVFLFITSLVEGVVIYNLRMGSVKKGEPDNPALKITTPAITTPTPVNWLRKVELNKIYLFPLEYQGSKIAEVKYLIKDFEFTKEVFVNFQKATITNDRVVLAFDIEITNDYDAVVKIMVGDYLRLSVNNEDKWIAPEVVSDPVEVRPHSTKDTRVGFTIGENDKNIKLQVGPLNGEKEIINMDKQ